MYSINESTVAVPSSAASTSPEKLFTSHEQCSNFSSSISILMYTHMTKRSLNSTKHRCVAESWDLSSVFVMMIAFVINFFQNENSKKWVTWNLWFKKSESFQTRLLIFFFWRVWIARDVICFPNRTFFSLSELMFSLLEKALVRIIPAFCVFWSWFPIGE